MKQKCEEIIIDQYLKGNITDNDKTLFLLVLSNFRDNFLFIEMSLKALTENPLQFLSSIKKRNQENPNPSTRTLEEIIEFIEEIEDELSE